MGNEKTLQLREEIIRIDKSPIISIEGFTSYVALMKEYLKAYLTDDEQFVISSTLLSADVGKSLNSITYDNAKSITKGLTELTDKTNIQLEKAKFRGYYIVNTKSLYYKNFVDANTEYFVVVPLDSINKIYRSNLPYKKRLARYYCCLLSLITGKNKGKVAFATFSRLAMMSGCSKNTCVKYNETLENLHLMKFYNYYLVDKNGRFMGNVFAQYKDSNLIEPYIKNHYQEYDKIYKEIIYDKMLAKSRKRKLVNTSEVLTEKERNMSGKEFVDNMLDDIFE